MSERYTRVFTLTEDLYSEGSPVVIRAGALLKDNTNGMVLAQLKFENISPKAIKALTVSIQPLDVKGSSLGEAVIHQYLDLNQERDTQFASKEAVFIPNAMTRSFTVSVAEVVFSDASYWAHSVTEWKQIEKPVSLSPSWEDELIKQYHLENGQHGQYFYKEIKGLWYCSCGALNRCEETICHKCGTIQGDLKNLDIVALRTRMSQRLEAEEKEKRIREDVRIKAEKQKKKTICYRTLIVILVLIVLLTAIFHISKSYMSKYGNNIISSEKHKEICDIFTRLGWYKDSSHEGLSKWNIECLYINNDNSMDNMNSVGKYENAVFHFKLLGGSPGESIKPFYRVIYTDGTQSDFKQYKIALNAGDKFHITVRQSSNNKVGKIEIILYDENKNMMGKAAIWVH